MATGNVRIAVNSSEKEEDDEIDEVEQVAFTVIMNIR